MDDAIGAEKKGPRGAAQGGPAVWDTGPENG